MKYFVEIAGRTHEVTLEERAGREIITVDGSPFELDYAEADTHGQVVVLHEGNSYALSIEGDGRESHVTLAGHHYGLRIEDERERAAALAARAASKGGGPIKAIMPGIVASILVEPGDAVSAGAPLLVLEAMKMQNEIRTPGDARVAEVRVAVGQAVAAGHVLIVLAPVDDPGAP